MKALIVAALYSPVGWFIAVYLAWGIVSGIVNTVAYRWLPKSEAEWASLVAKSPRLAALVDFLKSWGWNLPGGVLALIRFFRGGPPGWLLGARPANAEQLEAVAKRAAAEAIEEVKRGAQVVQAQAGEPILVLPREDTPHLVRTPSRSEEDS